MLKKDAFGEPVRFFYPGEDKTDNFKSIYGGIVSLAMVLSLYALGGSLFIDKFVFGPAFTLMSWDDVNYYDASTVITSTENFKVAFSTQYFDLQSGVDYIQNLDETYASVNVYRTYREGRNFIKEKVPYRLCTTDDFSSDEADN